MLVTLQLKLDGRDLGEVKTGAVPNEGQGVVLEHTLRGRRRYRVVGVEHQYTELGSRRVEKFLPAPVVVHLQVDDR